MEPQSHAFHTSDQARLHYLELGKGHTLIMIPGGGLSSSIFQHQMEVFARYCRVVALDMRGHGRSETVAYGYRISRLAKDLSELIEFLGEDKVHILCHSLGASVIYQYYDLFGPDRLAKLVIVDEPAVLMVNPSWSNEQRRDYGAIYEAKDLHELTNAFLQQDLTSIYSQMINMMTTSYAKDKHKQLIMNSFQLPGPAAAQLYLNNITQDFRDVISKITLPTLLITGRASLHPWQSHLWMQQQMRSAQLEIFEEHEGGNHFMFVENPEKFNSLVLKFLQ